MTTTIEKPAGEVLASGMQIKSGFAELNREAVEEFNADATAHGAAWDKTFADSEALIDAAETLKLADLKKQLNAVASSQLSLLQERLALFSRRQELLQTIHAELNDRVEACKDELDSVRESVESGLRASGAGPEDSLHWKRGSTNLAQIEFNKTVESTTAFVEAQKTWRDAKWLFSDLYRSNEWSSASEIRSDLRQFVANMTGLIR